jgi:hypothetical protein
MKIAVNPSRNPAVPKNALPLWPSGFPPAKKDRYTGSRGKRQGEIKVIIPSRNKSKYCICTCQEI